MVNCLKTQTSITQTFDRVNQMTKKAIEKGLAKPSKNEVNEILRSPVQGLQECHHWSFKPWDFKVSLFAAIWFCRTLIIARPRKRITTWAHSDSPRNQWLRKMDMLESDGEGEIIEEPEEWLGLSNVLMLKRIYYI